MAETATSSKNGEPEALVQRPLAAVDDVKVHPDDGVPMDIAFAEIREKLYKDELALSRQRRKRTSRGNNSHGAGLC